MWDHEELTKHRYGDEIRPVVLRTMAEGPELIWLVVPQDLPVKQ